MRFLVKLLNHWYLFLIPVLVLPIAGGLYGKQKLSTYESSALLHIYSIDTVAGTNTNFNQYVSAAQQGSDLINEYLQSNTFALAIAEATDLRQRYDLTSRADKDIVVQRIRGDVLVTPTGAVGNNVTVTVDDKDPKLALQIANAVISVTVSYFGSQRLEYDKHAETLLTQQLGLAQVQLTKDTKNEKGYLAIHPDANFPDGHDPLYESLQTLEATDQATVTDLTNRIKALKQDEEAQSTDSTDSNSVFNVLDYPLPPLRPTLHLKGLVPYAGGGLAAALALILLIVGAQTLLDRKVYSTRDLRTITEELELDIPLLTEIPLLEVLTRSSRHQRDDVLSGVLVPILTVLPQSSTEVLNHEIRRAVGVSVMDEN